MPDVQFETGVFHTYRATSTINIGAIETQTQGGYNIAKDELFQYDGDTIVLKDGRKFPGITQMRSAIRAGWFVPESNVAAQYQPKSAGIQVRAAEQHGRETVKYPTITESYEESTVGSVEARTLDREAKHEAISRGLPIMESREGQGIAAKAQAQVAVDPLDPFDLLRSGPTNSDKVLGFLQYLQKSITEGQARFVCQDAEMLSVAQTISQSCLIWVTSKIQERCIANAVQVKGPPNLQHEMESLFAQLDEDQSELPTKSRFQTLSEGTQSSPPTRLVMPLQNGDDTGEAGQVVGVVPRRTIVEEEQSITLNLAPAKPQATPIVRPGMTGGVVVDDQRDMGQIGLSQRASQTTMEVKVASNTTDSVRVPSVQVGGKQQSTIIGDQEGVPVGRILSPTHTEFVASDSNTSSSAIERAQGGKTLQVERIKAASATGDVQETRSGEELTELLPDAAVSPKVKVYLQPEDDPAYKAVQSFLPEFQWDKNRRWQDRVEDALKYVGNPPYLKGIIAVETETVATEIKKRLAVVLEAKKSQN